MQHLVAQIHETTQSIAAFDEQLRDAVAVHPDEPLFRSLPGAGDALVPRLIAAFGSDRERDQSAEEIQCCSGIAPVTKQSGKSKLVCQRFQCPKFLKQTFHEFADHARKWSPWAKAYYNMKRAAGMKHNAAVRSLAFKWMRIMFHLWKHNATYSEQKYQQQLQAKNSPVIRFLESA